MPYHYSGRNLTKKLFQLKLVTSIFIHEITKNHNLSYVTVTLEYGQAC